MTAIHTLADTAEGQWGLFTRRQAEATGMAWTTLSRMASSGVAERVAHGVYRFRGVPGDDRLELHAAWLQLAPDTPAWERTVEQGVVSHRSAAAVFGLGHLAADVHEFAAPTRKQTRRPDVRLHRAPLDSSDVIKHSGILVTRPARIVADMLAARESPDDVAEVLADVLRAELESRRTILAAVEPFAPRMGHTNGSELLAWLLEGIQDPVRDNRIGRA